MDLCVILGNLLDNAIESCRKIAEEEERFLRDGDSAAAVR
ncbi:MAG: GHKL domain-containing protein [Clostridia bacterium]|nr:GHKL domain-containing protein [Clostridia bacterium]